MRSIMKYSLGLFLLICSFVTISCSRAIDSTITEDNSSTQEIIDNSLQGNATVKMFVPDYYALAEQKSARAIAPQSVSARLCYLVNGSWVGINTVSLANATKTPVENAPQNFTGSVYTLSFSCVPVGTYSAGNLRIELLNSSNEVITSGTNTTAVSIIKGSSSSTTFYTLPEITGASSGNLAAGEMKFSRAALVKGVTYSIVLTASGDYPDLVLFGSDGRIKNYYAIDDESTSRIELTIDSTDVYYLGLWADDGNDIARYTLNFDYGEGTQLSGVLTGTNLHWTKENSPYFVNANILVEEGTELTIEPGVIVQFTGNYYLKVTGTISAVGTKPEPIIFVQSGDNLNSWAGISIDSTTPLNLTNTYTYTSGNRLKNCMIIGASTPLTLNSETYVDSCTFTGDDNCVNVQGRNSIIINNILDSGIDVYGNNTKVINNNIRKEIQIQFDTENSLFKNNTITNATISFGCYWNYYFEFLSNIIHSCFINFQHNEGINSNAPISGNNFIGYNGIILDVTTCNYANTKLFNFTGNYWGESQTAEIESKCGKNIETENKNYNLSFITDYYDNFENTKVDFSNWATSPIEGAGYLGDGFIAFDYTINGYDYNNGGYYPETTNEALSIVVNPKYHTNDISYIRIAQSSDALKTTDWTTYTSNQSFTVNKDSLVDGIANIYVQLKDSEGNVSSPVMHEIPYDKPVVTFSIADGTEYSNATSSVNLRYGATDKGSLTQYSLFLDGVKVSTEEYSYGWGQSASWSYSLGIAYMSSGTHTIKASIWDSARNQTDKEITFTINRNVDTSALAGTSYDATTGQLLKDNNTIYLWHLDSDSTEASGDSALSLTSYNAGLGCFNGNASYLYQDGSSGIPLEIKNNVFTVECWRKGSDLSIAKADSFSIGPNSLSYNYKTPGGSISSNEINSPSYFNDLDWHYWSYVYGGNYMAIYCDGILICYQNGLTQTLNTNDSGLYIWAHNIDELRISKIARSPDEIAAYYNAVKDKIQ